MMTHIVPFPCMVRQGDVLLYPIVVDEGDIGSELAAGIPMKGSSRLVLAYGEATGHAHAFYEDGRMPRLFALKNTLHYSAIPGAKLLRLLERALLRHEEHSTISLPPGDYLFIQQHEGDEYAGLRAVTD